MTGEERERKMLDDQIARAKAEHESASKDNTPANLEKREGEKISLSLFPAAATTNTGSPPTTSANTEAGPSAPATSISFGASPTTTIGSSSKPTPLVNPLKRPAPVNVFKSAKPKTSTDSDSGSNAPIKQKQLSEVERLMMEDQARKMNRPAARGGYQGHGPRRG